MEKAERSADARSTAVLHHTHATIGCTIASIIVVDVNEPKPDPVRKTLCRLVGAAGSVLFGNMEMFDFPAITPGTAYENADETNARERSWPEETQIVCPAQTNVSLNMHNIKIYRRKSARAGTRAVKNLLRLLGQSCN